MAKCPVCQHSNDSLLCPNCSFDGSRDYEHYPTLNILQTPYRTLSKFQKDWQTALQDRLHCDNCGTSHFYYMQSTQNLMCVNCGKTMSIIAQTAVPTTIQSSDALSDDLAAENNNPYEMPLDWLDDALNQQKQSLYHLESSDCKDVEENNSSYELPLDWLDDILNHQTRIQPPSDPSDGKIVSVESSQNRQRDITNKQKRVSNLTAALLTHRRLEKKRNRGSSR